MYPKLNNPTYIVVHCSASRWGDATEIEKWHKANGWSRIGYHYIVLNGYRKSSRSDRYDPKLDGAIESLLDLDYQGIHCPSMNAKAIAICLVGSYHYSMAQLSTLLNLVISLMDEYDVPFSNVIGHYETPEQKNKRWPSGDMPYHKLQEIIKDTKQPKNTKTRKTCPGFSMDFFRDLLDMRLERRR